MQKLLAFFVVFEIFKILPGVKLDQVYFVRFVYMMFKDRIVIGSYP